MLVFIFQLSLFAQENHPVEKPSSAPAFSNPFLQVESFINQAKEEKSRADEEVLKAIKSSGIPSLIEISSEDQLAIAYKVFLGNPELIKIMKNKKVHEIELNQESSDKMKQLVSEKRMAIIQFVVTGKISSELNDKINSALPELKKLSHEEKSLLFGAGKKAAQEMLIKEVVEANAEMGYLLGNTSSANIAQMNLILSNIRVIKIGDARIENLNLRLQVGYPEISGVLLSGDLKLDPNSPVTIKTDLLSLNYDHLKKITEFSVADLKLKYEVLPWLSANGGLNLGLRNYGAENNLDLALDPSVGIEVFNSGSPLKSKFYTDATYQVVQNNFVLDCGGSLGLDLIDEDDLQLSAGILSRLRYESNPRLLSNDTEVFNGISVHGKF